MASYLVHYIANQVGRDYTSFEKILQSLEAIQLTEELWLIESDIDLQVLTSDLFSDRPPTDRFLLIEITSASTWSAANLMADPRSVFATVSHRYVAVSRLPSVKLFNPNQPPRELLAGTGERRE